MPEVERGIGREFIETAAFGPMFAPESFPDQRMRPASLHSLTANLLRLELAAHLDGKKQAAELLFSLIYGHVLEICLISREHQAKAAFIPFTMKPLNKIF